jgi:hypothetical protein
MLSSTPPKPPSNLVPRSALKKRSLGHGIQFSPNLVNSQNLPTGSNNVAARKSIGNTTLPQRKNIYLNPFMSYVFAQIEKLSEDRDGMIRLVNQINSYITNPQTFTLAEKQDQLTRVKGDTKKEARINAIYDLVERILKEPLKKNSDTWNQSLMLNKIDSRYPASNYTKGGTRRKRASHRCASRRRASRRCAYKKRYSVKRR